MSSGLKIRSMASSTISFDGIHIGSRGNVKEISGSPIPPIIVDKRVVIESAIPITEVNGIEMVINNLRICLAKAKKSIRVVSETEIYIDGIKAEVGSFGPPTEPGIRYVMDFSGCKIVRAVTSDSTFTNCTFDSIQNSMGSVTATGNVDRVKTSHGNITCHTITGKAKTTFGRITKARRERSSTKHIKKERRRFREL